MTVSDYSPEDNNGSQSILGADIHTDIANKLEVEGFKDSPEGIEELQAHYLDMMNPEYFRTQEPIEEAYKREQTRLAEAWLVQDGYRLITEGKIVPSLFSSER